MKNKNVDKQVKIKEEQDTEITDSKISELVESHHQREDNQPTIVDVNSENLEYQLKVRNATFGNHILGKEAGYAERAKYRLIKLYYKFLDVMVASPTYLNNKSELPEINTIPYLYIKEECNCTKFFLEIMNISRLKDMEKVNNDPVEWFINGCELYSDLSNDGETTNPNDETIEIIRFLKKYLEDKRTHISILKQIINYYKNHPKANENQEEFETEFLENLIDLIKSGMTKINPDTYKDHLLYNTTVFTFMKDKGLFTNLFNQFLIDPNGVSGLLKEFKQLAEINTQNEKDRDLFRDQTKNLLKQVNKDGSLDKQFNYIASINRTTFLLSNITLQITLPNEMKIDDAVVDSFNIKYDTLIEKSKPFRLYERIDKQCINALIRLAYYSKKPEEVSYIINSLPDIKVTYLNNMLKDIFLYINESKSLIDKKNKTLKINLELTNPTYLIVP